MKIQLSSVILGLALLMLGLPIQSQAQYGYWQQRVSYYMEVDFDVDKHQYDGFQRIVYFNQSPDTLDRVYFYLHLNAFQPGSMLDVHERSMPDPSPKIGDRISKLTKEEIGFQKIQKILQDGQKSEFKVEETILTVPLLRSLLPGDSVVLEMDYQAQIPLQVRRNGRDNAEGISYSMSQWYPKLCEYDREGWHASPYIAREFYGVWGDFELKLSIDSAYTVGGSGYLQNPQEVGHGYEDKTKPLMLPKGKKLLWHFKAPQVHDFAWAADPDYTHDIVQVPGGPVLHFLYQEDEEKYVENWKTVQPLTAELFVLFNSTFGEYPYEQYSIVQAGDGGMEYPMATLVTGHRNIESLFGVIAHEGAHSWFQGVLGTNEMKYAWMDEGFADLATTYARAQIRDYGKDLNNIYARSYQTYWSMVEYKLDEPSLTPADYFQTNFGYFTTAYSKGVVFLNQLEYIIGTDVFFAGVRRYYDTWKFKHPEPRDLKRVMEKTSGIELDWYFDLWLSTTKRVEYGIKEVAAQGKKTLITLERSGDIPMPIEVLVITQDNRQKLFYLPLDLMNGEKTLNYNPEVETETLEDWRWVDATYQLEVDVKVENITSIIVDPSFRLADVNYKNNVYPAPEESESESEGE